MNLIFLSFFIGLSALGINYEGVEKTTQTPCKISLTNSNNSIVAETSFSSHTFNLQSPSFVDDQGNIVMVKDLYIGRYKNLGSNEALALYLTESGSPSVFRFYSDGPFEADDFVCTELKVQSYK